MPNTSRFSCSLSRVVVPSWAASATNCASPALSVGSTAKPDWMVRITLVFGTVPYCTAMTRRPFGNVRSARGGGAN